jgi:hypothetical protein
VTAKLYGGPCDGEQGPYPDDPRTLKKAPVIVRFVLVSEDKVEVHLYEFVGGARWEYRGQLLLA